MIALILAVALTADAPSRPLDDRLLLAVEAASRGDVSLAESELRKLVLDAPDYVPARLELASVFLAQHLLDDAEKAVRKALEVDGTRAASHGALGRVLFHQERFREAADAYAHAEELGLYKEAFVIEHGRALESLADLEGAARVYQQGASNLPGELRPRRRLGAVLLSLGRPAEAIAPLEAARDLKPESPDTHYQLGMALSRAGQVDAAIKSYERATELAPRFARAHYELGNLLVEAGREREGKKHLARFRELSEARDRADHKQGKIGTLNREGLRLMREGDPKGAIKKFEQAIALGPSRGAVHANLALARLATGERERAIEAIEQAIALDGETELLSELLARARQAALP